MLMRRGKTLAMLIIGFSLMVVSYFFLAAPWGFPPSSVVYSNPRVVLVSPTLISVQEYAFLAWLLKVVEILTWPPVIFILGVMMVFLSAVVYELLPEKRSYGARQQQAGLKQTQAESQVRGPGRSTLRSQKSWLNI